MSFDFGLPGFVRRVLPHIGTMQNRSFNLRKELETMTAQLQNDADVLEIMKMRGWDKIVAEYQQVIELHWSIIRDLSLDAKKHADSIQQRRHLIEACELLIETMRLPAERYHRTAERQKQLERFKQERRSYAMG